MTKEEAINACYVLDDVRAEIERKIVTISWLNLTDREKNRNDAFFEALEIIDKYKMKVEG